jgi:hypothetical protein
MTDDAKPRAGSGDVISQIEEFLGTEAGERSSGFDWVKSLPVALSIAGLVLYGVITIADERFYGALGITGGDVGLSYTNTLVRASGLVIFFGAVAAALGVLITTRRRSQPSFNFSDIVRAVSEGHFPPEMVRRELLFTRLKSRERERA